MTMGQRIQQIRLQRNLSQEEFAEKLKTTRQSVSRWELDQSYPELEKIVMISKIFSVTTDSILVNNISTFDMELDRVNCGIYRSETCEIVETEQFALMFYSSDNGDTIGTKLYYGYDKKKKLIAVCERSLKKEITQYAYSVHGGSQSTVVSNSDRLAALLNAPYDNHAKDTMHLREKFEVDHSGEKLPIVKEVGFRKCLERWREADSYYADRDSFNFSLCIGKNEFIFSINPKDTNIYCGASYNIVFDLGIFAGGQYFRLRNYRDNTEPWCGFHCDFTAEMPEVNIPIEQCAIGQCVLTNKGIMWCVKRYNDDEIILQGCGNDEYTYRRNDKRTERFV